MTGLRRDGAADVGMPDEPSATAGKAHTASARATAPGAAAGGWSTVRLVAAREITTRVRERSFLISIALTLLLIGAVTVVPAWLSADEPPVIGYTDRAGEALARDAARVPAEEVPRVVPLSPQAVESALEDGRVDVVVSKAGARAQKAPPAPALSALQQAHRQRGVAAAVDRSGLSAAQAQSMLSPPALAVNVREPVDADSESRAGVAFITALILYMQLLTYGFFVASGVVEEKSSRVIELMLAAVRPRDLMAGKLLGIGVLGLGQMTVIAAAGLLGAQATGALTIDSDLVSVAALAAVWFVLGYAFYAALFACAGALVPRQEELQAVTTPLVLVIVICAMVSFSLLQDPASALARWGSLLPPMAPMLMPARIVLGEAAAWDVAASVAISVAVTIFLVPLAARIYAGALLGTRTRVKLREAWRASRS